MRHKFCVQENRFRYVSRVAIAAPLFTTYTPRAQQLIRLGIGLTFSLSFIFALLSALAVNAQSQLSSSAAGVIRVVAPNGSDTDNGCTTLANPCQTLQHALNQAEEGDEIRVAAGTYGGVMQGILSEVGEVTATLIITKNLARLEGGYTNDFANRNPSENLTILDGSASAGGWVILSVSNSAVIDGFRISGANSPNGQGGGIHILDGSPIISNNEIMGNHSPRRGGAIYVSTGSPTILSNRILSNTANREGGAIYVLTGTVTITGNQIIGNHAETGSGGGIYIANGSSLIANNTIANNHAISLPNARGGGIIVRRGQVLGIYGNRIYANQSADGGSGIEMNTGGAIHDNFIFNNKVLVAGSALLVEKVSTPVTITNNLIYKNEGTGITIRDFLEATINNNTSDQNRYVSFGGPGNGIDVNASITPTFPFTATIFNNLFTNNEQCGIEAYNGVSVVIDYNGIFGNKTEYCNVALVEHGANDLNLDPQYLDAAGNNYRPAPGTSPVVNNGTPVNAPSYDIFGDVRPYGNGVDMGAVEAGPAFIYLPMISR